MKSLILIFVALFLVFLSCGPLRDSATADQKTATVELSSDSLDVDKVEHELIIIDPGFSLWYSTRAQPVGFHSQLYLENWNFQLVRQWNSMVMSSSRSSCRPQTIIDYHSDEDYGLELNHQLFYYFQYMHERCRLFSHRPGNWR